VPIRNTKRLGRQMLTNKETRTRRSNCGANSRQCGFTRHTSRINRVQKRIHFPRRQSPRKSSSFQSSTYLFISSPSVFLVNSRYYVGRQGCNRQQIGKGNHGTSGERRCRFRLVLYCGINCQNPAHDVDGFLCSKQFWTGGLRGL
jgi:hypothetical protein